MIIKTTFRSLIGSAFIVTASSAAAGTDTSGAGTPTLATARAPIRDRGVFIAQVGTENRATVTQVAPVALARIDQDGDRNRATIVQRGAITAYADLRQAGASNDATVAQSGSGGEAVILVTQIGSSNLIRSDQQSGRGAENGAVLLQAGTGNLMTLEQSGDDNLARLTQDGDNNQMTASQSGAGNRLIWTQQGNGLSNLAITQSGGQLMQVTQRR